MPRIRATNSPSGCDAVPPTNSHDDRGKSEGHRMAACAARMWQIPSTGPSVNAISMIIKAGWPLDFRAAAGLIWRTRFTFRLRCDLGAIPPGAPAKIPVCMQPVEPSKFAGFQVEFENATGSDAVEVYFRERLREAGVRTLYVSHGNGGSPVFVQWVVTKENQHLIHANQPGQFPALDQGEVLLDGAYTFSAFRRQGVMSEGLRQVLRIAREEGASRAYAYVWSRNIPSLRECAKVGFHPIHMRVDTRRFGRQQSVLQPVSDYWKQWWDAAVSAKCPTRSPTRSGVTG